MLCSKPIIVGSQGCHRQARCGQCAACRIRRRDEWVCRIVLEVGQCSESQFLTLTYNDDALTRSGSRLNVRDLQLFLKRLRFSIGRPIRYFGCGEYGSKSGRKHWHLLIFGAAPFEMGLSRHALWSEGFIHAGECSPKTARYCAKYCLKSRAETGAVIVYSRQPALGVHAAPTLAKAALEMELAECPFQVRVGSKVYPVPRRLRDAVNALLEAKSGQTPVKAMLAHADVLNIWAHGDPLLATRKVHTAKAEKHMRLSDEFQTF